MTTHEAFELWWDVWGPCYDGSSDRKQVQGEIRRQCWRAWQASRLSDDQIEPNGDMPSGGQCRSRSTA